MSRAAYNENLDILDEMAVKKGEGIAELVGGTLTERPEPEIPGRYYFAQDKGEIWLDTGTEWVLAAASRTAFLAHLADIMPHAGAKNLLHMLGSANARGVQYGTTTITINTAGTAVAKVITFDVAFSGSNPIVFVTLASPGGGSAGYINLSQTGESSTGFTLHANSYIAQTLVVYWLAIGD